MKNNLYVVYGGKCDEDDVYNVWYTEFAGEPRLFKNREKAEAYVDELLDGFMKTKCYSHNYLIEETEVTHETPVITYQTDIYDKHDYRCFRVEMLVLDLSNVIM